MENGRERPEGLELPFFDACGVLMRTYGNLRRFFTETSSFFLLLRLWRLRHLVGSRRLGGTRCW